MLNIYGGMDYIVSAIGSEMYGVIVRHVDFGEITDLATLANKAIECLEKNIESTMSIEVSAFDMGLVDETAGTIKVGTFVEVRSEPHELQKAYICTGIEIDITNPANSKYTLGVNADTLTTRQMRLTRNISNTTGQTVENPSYNVKYGVYRSRVTVQAVHFKRSGSSVHVQFRVRMNTNLTASTEDPNKRLFTYDTRFNNGTISYFDTGYDETKKKSFKVFVTYDGFIGIVLDTVSVSEGDIITGNATWTYITE